MNRWKRVVVVASAGVTLATTGVVVASATPAGAAALRTAGNALASAISQSRPMVDGGGGGGGSGSNLPPMVLKIGKVARFTSQLTVNVSVTYSCGPFVSQQNAQIQLQLSEVVNKTTVAQGYGYDYSLVCDGNEHKTVITADAQNAPFHPGAKGLAQLNASASGIDSLGNYDFESANTQSTVSIQK